MVVSSVVVLLLLFDEIVEIVRFVFGWFVGVVVVKFYVMLVFVVDSVLIISSMGMKKSCIEDVMWWERVENEVVMKWKGNVSIFCCV